MLTFTVPGQPVGKGRPRVGRVGTRARMFTPQKTARYESLVAHAASMAMDGAALIVGAVSIDIRIFMQIPASWSQRKRAAANAGEVLPITRPDWDNVAKTLDGLNGVVWRDDAQVVNARVVKRYADTPRLVISVEPVEGRNESISA